ncbi:hypothetical protein K2173_011956 [Erythroxylum novogranatense]|uniref:Methyltransferase domain-containing protein n=1 Tax=Erythroxylum novogranatense TaxID=1862640 RepID=A0AAV8UAU8_9ROSI|nr:hypothetical protein K2173_011956 [Erythroxylum novogranatense]
MALSGCKYSCETGVETLEWINAIVSFIKPYHSLINAHVVNFFKDRLWESIDKDWIHCLRQEPVQNLLLVPSGVVQDHWPNSLKEFVKTIKSLVFPREQVDLHKVFPDLNLTLLNSVLAQGMNTKKKHEVEVLSAVVDSIANSVNAQTIVDVGAGQGYLAQVLSFQYQHSVVAIDASSHHGKVIDARAERIRRYYVAQMNKFDSGKRIPDVPKTITCRVMSTNMLRNLTKMSLTGDDVDRSELIGQVEGNKMSFLLTGLHACGDLSVTMLKTFLECEEVKAVVSIGCCYNLLSEECSHSGVSGNGFPMSHGIKSVGVSLGKNSRDLACQSAERWSYLENDAALHNFDVHAFRAAFQMVLLKYYPELIRTSPSIGRQGKALRRQQQRNILKSSLHGYDSDLLLRKDTLLHEMPCNGSTRTGRTASANKCLLFKNFCYSGLSRLALEPLQETSVQEIWREAEPFAVCIISSLLWDFLPKIFIFPWLMNSCERIACFDIYSPLA